VPASDPHHLQRFVEAQHDLFDIALAELRAGAKRSHWMWFVFPQLAGLGRSPTAQYYAIRSLDEARAFLAHPLLGPRLRQSCEALLAWAGKRAAEQILGPVDALKLCSSATLFDRAAPGSAFARVIDDFYAGARDKGTLALLDSAQ
jgi:uncharacterized protein (DUF1810 family)